MRVALAAVLFARPDLLLLDEPTNYLDLEGTMWLDDYLKTYPRTLIVISHDRDLLDDVADSILHLERGKLTLYTRRLLPVRAPARRAHRAAGQSGEETGRRSASICTPSSTASAPRPPRRARPSRG